MEWASATAMLAIPLVLGVGVVLTLRGPWRGAAMFPLAVLAGAWGLDAYSASRRGNLTGLFTMIAAVPSLALLLLIWAAHSATRLRRRRSGAPNPDPD